MDIEAEEIKTLAAGAGVSLLGKVGGRVFHMVGQILLARLLGPQGYGLFSIGWNINRIISFITPLGLDQGVVHFSNSNNIQRKTSTITIVQAIRFSIISGTAMSLVLYWLSPFIAEVIFNKPDLTIVIKIFSISIPFFAGLRVSAAASRISRSMKYSTISQELSQPSFCLLIYLVFCFAGLTVINSIVITVISFAFSFSISIYHVNKLYPRVLKTFFSKPVISKKLISYSLPNTTVVIFFVFVTVIDRILVGYFRSDYEAGIYQAAAIIPIIFVMILSAITAIFSPMASSLFHLKDFKKIDELYSISTKWGFYLGAPFFLIILFSSSDILSLLFGEEYQNGYYVFIIIGTAQFINLITGPVDSLLVMTENQRVWSRISASMLVLNIILNFLLISIYGMLGAAITILISNSIFFSLGLYYARKKLTIQPYDHRFIKCLVSLFITAGILYIIIPYLSTILLPIRVFLVSVISFLLFFILIYMLGFDKEDYDVIEQANMHFRILTQTASEKILMNRTK